MQISAHYSKGVLVLIVVAHAAPNLSDPATLFLSLYQVTVKENTLQPAAEEEDLLHPIKRFGKQWLDAKNTGKSHEDQHNPLPHEASLDYPLKLKKFGQPTNQNASEVSVEELSPEVVPVIADRNGNVVVGEVKNVVDKLIRSSKQRVESGTDSAMKRPESKPAGRDIDIATASQEYHQSKAEVEGHLKMQNEHGKASPPAEGKIIIDEVIDMRRREKAGEQPLLTKTTNTPATLEEQLGVPEQPDERTALTGTRGGARMAQPWIFSVMMLGILSTFIMSAYCFFKSAMIQPTEELIRQFLDKCKSSTIPELMEETAEGCQTPVPLLVARRLVKRAVDEQEEMKLMYRRTLYNDIKSELLEEHRKASRGKTKEERAVLDEGIRQRLLEEKEKIRAACKRDWAHGRLQDPVPSLGEAEAWCTKLEHYWQQQQMAST